MFTFKPKTEIDAENLEKYKLDVCSEINSLKEILLLTGYEVSPGQFIQCDDTTITRFNGVSKYAASLTYPFEWICSDNSIYEIQTGEFEQLGLALLQTMSTVIVTARKYKNDVLAAISKEDVDSVLEAYKNLN